jgi:probable HAF family extracellular repeat protein
MRLRITVFFTLFCASGISVAEIRYSVIDLGTLGGVTSYAWSINDSGQIVGSSWDSSGRERPCLFDPTGGGANTDLRTLGGDSGIARAVNASGQIVGYAYDSGRYVRACIFDPTGAGNNIELPTLGSNQSRAFAISNSGQIVGSVFDSTRHSWRACWFDPEGGPAKVLGPSVGTSLALSVNDRIQIVGYAFTSSGFRAYLFNEQDVTSNVNLGTLGGPDSDASSINNSGQIVGWAGSGSGYPHACLFDPTGGGANIDLGTLSGYERSSAYFINDVGQIIGSAYNSEDQRHACLFDPTGHGNNIDLNTLIEPSSGWRLVYPNSINNNGSIVGWGINPEGYEHAFLLTPIPEPATLLLFCLGALIATKRQK